MNVCVVTKGILALLILWWNPITQQPRLLLIFFSLSLIHLSHSLSSSMSFCCLMMSSQACVQRWWALICAIRVTSAVAPPSAWLHPRPAPPSARLHPPSGSSLCPAASYCWCQGKERGRGEQDGELSNSSHSEWSWSAFSHVIYFCCFSFSLFFLLSVVFCFGSARLPPPLWLCVPLQFAWRHNVTPRLTPVFCVSLSENTT